MLRRHRREGNWVLCPRNFRQWGDHPGETSHDARYGEIGKKAIGYCVPGISEEMHIRLKPNLWKDEPNLSHLIEACELQTTDPVAALRQFQLLANHGSRNSLIYAGIAYRDGIGTEKNLEEAENWFKKALRADVEASILYLSGIYLERLEYQLAVDILEKGVNKKYMPAAYWLSRIYMKGPPDFLNEKRGWELLELAATNMNIYAMRDFSLRLMKAEKGIFSIITGAIIFIRMSILVISIASRDENDQRLKPDGIY